MPNALIRLGFTGTRRGMTPAQRRAAWELLRFLAPAEAHHGDCVGADADFHQLAASVGTPLVVIHPPASEALRAFCGVVRGIDQVVMREPRAPLDRNRVIVAETTHLLACPATADEELRSGTWATIRAAHRLARPTLILAPDGRILGGLDG